MEFIKRLYRSGRLSRWLIFVAIVMFIVGYLSFRETTQEKFMRGCLEGSTQPTVEMCQCLTEYVFEHLEAMQVIAIMEPDRIRSQRELENIQRVMRDGTQQCGW
ncbi:hypothetical protein [Desulfurispira natronophila]|uniref:Uncharacterized protein n=1 Tax=Desulfurispira natronophila TaxID=682562 RepID=A0A7W7Y4W4_9BACT|nr:hypothetical protein [Desulfurispira natronophila]MBB5022148.1 hypothetical protein [Desulfurispira natronophila]